MRYTLPTVLAFAASFAISVPQSVDAATVRPLSTLSVKKTTTITSRIINAAGESLGEARVMIYVDGMTDPIVSMRADADGRFKITLPIDSATYTLRILRVGYTPVSLTLVRGADGWEVPAAIVMQPIPSVF